MRTPDLPTVTTTFTERLPRGLAVWAEHWARVREPLAGAGIVIGLCWPFMFSSVLPVRWWMFLPFAIGAGLIRQRKYPRSLAPYVPLWGFFLVLLLFAGIATAYHPMTAYGAEKIRNFALLAAAAYIAAARQAPLTEDLVRGMRWTLLLTLGLGVLVALYNRDIYLETDKYGLDELRALISTTGFPLSLALAAAGVIAGRANPRGVLLSSAGLLGAALLSIMVRGRFDAGMLVMLAVLVLLGPPWKHIFWRVFITGLVAMFGLWLYQSVLPQLGRSYEYLTWFNTETMGGRTILFKEAWEGFWRYPFGHGIGSFALLEPIVSYPHNIVLEVAYELGILGLVAMGAIYVFAIRRFWQLWVSPPHRVLAALLLLVMGHILKAGDLAMLPFHWIYLYLLIVGTPLAHSWPLAKGRAAA